METEYINRIDKFLLTILKENEMGIKKLIYVNIDNLNNTVRIDFRDLKIEDPNYSNLYGTIHMITLPFFNYKEKYYFEFDIKNIYLKIYLLI